MITVTSTLQSKAKPNTTLRDRDIRDILGLARNCRLGPQQNALEVAAHVAIATSDYDDFSFMRRQVGIGGELLYCDTAIKVVKACLAHKEINVAVGAMNAVRRNEVNSKIAGAWAQIYAIGKRSDHLSKAREIAKGLPLDEASIAFAEIFALGCDESDWAKCCEAIYGDGQEVDQHQWDSRHAQETRASAVVVLAQYCQLQEAVSLFATLTRPNPTFRAATAIGAECREREYLETAIDKARANHDLRLKSYRRIPLLAALLEDEETLYTLRQRPWSDLCGTAGYCYATALYAAIAGPGPGLRILRKAKETAQQVSTYGESSLALTAYAWALARCGDLREAMDIASRLQENLQRCITYLAIANAESDLETVIDLGL